MRASNSSSGLMLPPLLLLVLVLLTPGLVDAFRISDPCARGGWARVQDRRRSTLAATTTRMSDGTHDDEKQVRIRVD